ncbi:hypothetical protein V6x_13200 [Gimesia chilikensis]|uniref:Uncharacterized protein n=1 Tax=Gimesia chilikensis TaxID=2605989 RepID=A0A517W8Q2_9PLAN|nr:hypothetical protein V6x_13200 [Gimesia chilikensis]
MDVGPDSLIGAIATTGNDIFTVILSATEELASAVSTILEFQSSISRSFKELVPPADIIHIHPEVQSALCTDVERRILEGCEVIDTIEFECAPKLSQSRLEYRPQGRDTVGNDIHFDAIFVVDGNIAGSLIEVPVCYEACISGKCCYAVVADIITIGLIQN